MDYELDFDTSLLDYHASKVDDLPYLDLFHDDKLDFGEDRQDCADLADAASPNDVIGGLFTPLNSPGPEDTEEDAEQYEGELHTPEDIAIAPAPVPESVPEDPAPKRSSRTRKKKDTKDKAKKDTGKTDNASSNKAGKKQKSDAPEEKDGEALDTKRPRRSARQYNLRQTSIINRIETEVRRAKPREPKPKSKPPPLSKYRRRTANSRERTRMAEINDAFEVLRKAVPNCEVVVEDSKLTKITTLRLALNYIGALRDMLGYGDSETHIAPSPDPATPPTSAVNSVPAAVAAAAASKSSQSSSCTPAAESKPTTHMNSVPKNCKQFVSCSADVTVTKGNLSAPYSADPALSIINTIVNPDPFTDFNLAAINFPSTVPSPGSSTTIPSPDNLSCINTNINCLSPGAMGCLSPDSMSCVSPSLSLTCSSPGSSISDSVATNYYGLPYLGLSNPLDSEGESVTSLS